MEEDWEVCMDCVKEDWRGGNDEWCSGRMLDMLELCHRAGAVWWSKVGPGCVRLRLMHEAQSAKHRGRGPMSSPNLRINNSFMCSPWSQYN